MRVISHINVELKTSEISEMLVFSSTLTWLITRAKFKGNIFDVFPQSLQPNARFSPKIKS
jgi:hypothetical protein